MLHCLQAADHGLDTGAHLLILLQQSRTLTGQAIEPLSQRAIFFPQLAQHHYQICESLLEQIQFLVRRRLLSEFVHGEDYAAVGLAGSNNLEEAEVAHGVIQCLPLPVLT